MDDLANFVCLIVGIVCLAWMMNYLNWIRISMNESRLLAEKIRMALSGKDVELTREEFGDLLDYWSEMQLV